MANYSPAEAAIFAREIVKGVPVNVIEVQVCDAVQTAIWNYFPWEFTITRKNKVGNVFIADATQDITGVPTDFQELLWARLTRTDLSDGNHYRDLTPVQRLEPMDPSIKRDYTWHEFISYAPETSSFRLEYPLYIYTGTELTELDIDYKKSPTKITQSNLNTPFSGQPDWFWPMFVDGVLWRFMVYANDRRQGGLQISANGQRAYTGQMGVFYNALIERAYQESKRYGALRYPAQGSLGAPTMW